MLGFKHKNSSAGYFKIVFTCNYCVLMNQISFFPLVLFQSEQSAFGITAEVKEDHSSRDLHRGPCCTRRGLAVGRPRWRQWKERKGGFTLRIEVVLW